MKQDIKIKLDKTVCGEFLIMIDKWTSPYKTSHTFHKKDCHYF